MTEKGTPSVVGFTPGTVLFDELGSGFWKTAPERKQVTIIKRQPEGSVGDVNSTARGSGARFNGGKIDYTLIPLRIIAESYGDPTGRVGGSAITALKHLGMWQETGETKWLYESMKALGVPNVWDECAQVFEYGRHKYAEWNWAKGMQWSIPLACAARHLMQIIDGKFTDDESKQTHRGHVISNIVMLLTFEKTYPEGDDRPRWLNPESVTKSTT